MGEEGDDDDNDNDDDSTIKAFADRSLRERLGGLLEPSRCNFGNILGPRGGHLGGLLGASWALREASWGDLEPNS